jgi:hypothetical protein
LIKYNKKIKIALWTLGILVYLFLFGLTAKSYIFSNVYADFSLPEEVIAESIGERIKVEIEVKNKTIQNINSEDNYFLSYHLYDSEGRVISIDNVRTPISGIMPGRKKRIEMLVDVPEKEGTYIIEADIVKENEYWFSDKGNGTAKSRLTVKGS